MISPIRPPTSVASQLLGIRLSNQPTHHLASCLPSPLSSCDGPDISSIAFAIMAQGWGWPTHGGMSQRRMGVMGCTNDLKRGSIGLPTLHRAPLLAPPARCWASRGQVEVITHRSRIRRGVPGNTMRVPAVTHAHTRPACHHPPRTGGSREGARVSQGGSLGFGRRRRFDRRRRAVEASLYLGRVGSSILSAAVPTHARAPSHR